MLRTHLALVALIPALALGWTACTADVDSGEDADLAEGEAAIATPQTGLFGTFRGKSKAVGTMPLLAFLADGTYHRSVIVPCMPSPCEPMEEDGLYQTWSRDGGTYLTLYPNDGSTADRLQYGLSGDTLRIRRMTGRVVFSLTRTTGEAWCEGSRDCALQNLPVGPCNGGRYLCATAEEVCHYSCYSPM